MQKLCCAKLASSPQCYSYPKGGNCRLVTIQVVGCVGTLASNLLRGIRWVVAKKLHHSCMVVPVIISGSWNIMLWISHKLIFTNIFQGVLFNTIHRLTYLQEMKTNKTSRNKGGPSGGPGMPWESLRGSKKLLGCQYICIWTKNISCNIRISPARLTKQKLIPGGPADVQHCKYIQRELGHT